MDVVGEFAFYTDNKQRKGKIMAKPSNPGKANKSHKSSSPKEGHAKSSGLGARPDKGVKNGHEKKMSARNDKAFRDVEKMAKGNKSKNGCLPKLFMMFLPFMVLGAYFLLST